MMAPPSAIGACPPHRWRLAEPYGAATVPGECLRCGTSRDFRASEPDSEFTRYSGFEHDGEEGTSSKPRKSHTPRRNGLNNTKKPAPNGNAPGTGYNIPAWLASGGIDAYPELVAARTRLGELEVRARDLSSRTAELARRRYIVEGELAEAEIGALVDPAAEGVAATAREALEDASRQAAAAEADSRVTLRAVVAARGAVARLEGEARTVALASLFPACEAVHDRLTALLVEAAGVASELRSLTVGILGPMAPELALLPAGPKELILAEDFEPSRFNVLDSGNLSLVELMLVRQYHMRATGHTAGVTG